MSWSMGVRYEVMELTYHLVWTIPMVVNCNKGNFHEEH